VLALDDDNDDHHLASLVCLASTTLQYVKDPRKEIHAHYFDAVLPEQFDVVIHVDRTSALRALDD
jgi:erythromycin esterase-like protein